MVYKIFHFTPEGGPFKILDNLRSYSNIPIKTMMFVYDYRYNILEIIDKYKSEMFKNSSYAKIIDDENTLLIDLNIVKNPEDPLTDNGKTLFLVSKKQPFGILISNTSSRKFGHIIQYFNKYYPLISRIFLRSNEIKELLNSLEEENAKIIVRNYVLKRYYVKRKIDVGYEVINHNELFKIAQDNFLWVDSIQIDISTDNFNGKIRINRRGRISYRGLDYSTIFSLLIEKIITKYSKKHSDILVKKSRTLNNLEPQPVRFFVDEEIFNSHDDIEQFLKSMHTNFNNWGYSILFNEGSYLLAILHDYQTGSSYDIIISSPSEVYIIPQTQVTSISFNALINFFIKNYDGEVENV